MKKIGNFYIQDDDSFFEYMYSSGFPMDGSIHREILKSVPKGNAIDVGAHVGIWSRQLTKKFDEVYAWEPIESNCECLRQNVPDVKIFPFAAASKQSKKFAKPDQEGNYGGYQLNEEEGEEVIVKVIDDFDFKNITFIQMHIKGMEYDALLGLERTIEKYLPTIVYQAYPHQLKQYGHSEEDIEVYLTSFGYKIELFQEFKPWDITYKRTKLRL